MAELGRAGGFQEIASRLTALLAERLAPSGVGKANSGYLGFSADLGEPDRADSSIWRHFGDLEFWPRSMLVLGKLKWHLASWLV